MSAWALAADIGTKSAMVAVQDRDCTRSLELTVPTPQSGDLPETLRSIALESARNQESAIPSRLVLAVPATWTDPELAVARQTALDMSFPDPEFVAQPVAAACYLGKGTVAGQIVAVLGIRDSSVDAAVLRRTQGGFELAGQPGGLALDEESGASLERGALELLATITAAGFAPGDLAAIYVTGQASQAALAVGHVKRILGIEPHVPPNPEKAILLGALALTCEPARPRAFRNGLTPTFRLLTAARKLAAAPQRGWVMYACLAAAVVALAGAAVTLALAHPGAALGGHGAPAQSAAQSSHVPYRLTMRTVSRTLTKPVSYRMRAQFPAVTGLPDAALQRRVNAELQAPVTRQMTSFAKLASSYPAGTSGAFMDITATVYQVKDVLSVKYSELSHNAGAADVSYYLNAVTIQMAAGGRLGVTDILTPAALAAAGRHTIAVDLQAQESISGCDTQPGWSGEDGLVKVLAGIRTPAAVILNVTPHGLAFSFQDDAISGTACHPVGVLPFAELSGLISPSFDARRPGPAPLPSVSTTASAPTSPAAQAQPVAVVQAYFKAINQRDYRLAWRLGGDHLGQSYNQFAAGFADTAKDIVRITAVDGGRVSIKLTAVHSDGKKLTFTGTCTVAGGAITGSDLQQAP